MMIEISRDLPVARPEMDEPENQLLIHRGTVDPQPFPLALARLHPDILGQLPAEPERGQGTRRLQPRTRTNQAPAPIATVRIAIRIANCIANRFVELGQQ